MLRMVLDVVDLLDSPTIDGETVARWLRSLGPACVECETVVGSNGQTDFIRVTIEGSQGRLRGGEAPTLGVIGRLGGIGARPVKTGLVSDADGAICALSVAARFIEMGRRGDLLAGDLLASTHICPDAPVIPYEPVPFMGSPVDMRTMNEKEVATEMDAILSIDTTKGNKLLNVRGFAISPTVKEGYILPVAPALLDLAALCAGNQPAIIPLSQNDVTPYGNGLRHLNSIMQPSVCTSAPVVGVGITSGAVVPGCATGTSNEVDIASAARFVVEVAKSFTAGGCSFYDPEEYELTVQLYGSMRRFQEHNASVQP